MRKKILVLVVIAVVALLLAYFITLNVVKGL